MDDVAEAQSVRLEATRSPTDQALVRAFCRSETCSCYFGSALQYRARSCAERSLGEIVDLSLAMSEGVDGEPPG